MVDNDMPEAWPVWTPVVSEKKIFYLFIFSIVSLWEPPGWDHFDPRGMIRWIYTNAQNNNVAFQI